MAREVITRVWCDLCLSEDTQTEGVETPPITLGGHKPRVLALCDVHTKEVYDPLRDLLREFGQVVDETAVRLPGTSPGSGIFPCPDPTCHKHVKPFKHEQSLRNHAKGVHGKSVTELRAVLAGEEPPAPVEPLVTEAKCDQPGCDKVYAYPAFKRPRTALGVHKAKAHGIPGKHKQTGAA